MLDVASGAELVPADFNRGDVPREMHLRPLEARLSDRPGWQSRGGAVKGHPARGFPSILTFLAPKKPLARIHILGVFALFADGDEPGSVGAVLSSSNNAFRYELVNGRHFREPFAEQLIEEGLGDGSVVSTVGCAKLDGKMARVDVLSFDLPRGIDLGSISFQQTADSASFVIFDIIFECETVGQCPFHSQSGGISLGELGGIIRIRDRVRFDKAVQQTHKALERTEDLDEARSEALTFLAIVTAGMLEAGGKRSLHRMQLEAARKFDQVTTVSSLIETSKQMIESVIEDWGQGDDLQPKLINRALSLVDRSFATDITDEDVANQVGMSTSHFRFLFKQSVGQPFHKFLIATRLEKSKILLEQSNTSISEIANTVGFSGLASFSRAFLQRFGVSPSEFRKVRGL